MADFWSGKTPWWDLLGCSEQLYSNCAAYQHTERPCWEIAGTQCCHASCGDCHVKGPAISGISAGLLKGHRFVKRDEGKTCALCHGGRVYPEFTGEYGGTPDVHYQKGMVCMDCHNKTEFHGDGKAYTSRQERKDRPACLNCHPAG